MFAVRSQHSLVVQDPGATQKQRATRRHMLHDIASGGLNHLMYFEVKDHCSVNCRVEFVATPNRDFGE
jgi:hypothetical protein